MGSRHLISDERGVTTVMVAMTLPLFLLLCVFAIDTGNWFVHKRQLQIKADAAALAGAGAYRFPSCSDADIDKAVLRYSGKGDGTVTYNAPDPDATSQDRLHAVFNGPNYYAQSHPNDSDLASNPGPCSSKIIDVKMTETDLPWFFGTGLVDNINARARVQLFQIAQGRDALPLAVQEATPRRVRAWIVDEETNTTLGSAMLSTVGSSGGLLRFENDTDPMSVTVPATVRRLGVRVALSGSTSTTCGDPLVQCFDNGAATGLSFIRAWSDSPIDLPTASAPRARSVSLSPGSCGNASFNANKTACAMEVTAKVKWNPDVTTADLGTKTKLTVVYAGSNYAMTYNTASGEWKAVGVSVPPGTIGPRSVRIDWEQQTGKVQIGNKLEDCTTTGGNKCKGTIEDTLTTGTTTALQRTFWNDPQNQSSRGGPIQELDVLDSTTLQQVNDIQRCSSTQLTCTYSFIVKVGIKGSLGLSKVGDPPVSLRVQGGSQNQTLDCDTGRDFVEEIAYGCSTLYKINTGTACSVNEPAPQSCVPIQTGTTANKPAKGFNIRFLCEPPGNPGNCGGTPGNWDGKPDTCPAAGEYGHNNWPNFPEGDPRVVGVFLTPFGTFQESGNALVPILDFAFFYVTAWSSTGSGFNNPCIGNGDVFVSGTESDTGAVSGHFFKYISPNTSGSGTEDCDFNDIGGCVAVLVK